MTVQVELEQLLGLALGTPEVGAVNFNILHGILREILKHLGIDKKVTEISEDGGLRGAIAILKSANEGRQDIEKTETDSGQTEKVKSEPTANLAKPSVFSTPQYGNLESKLSKIEKRLELLDDIPSNTEILQRAKQKQDARTPVGDMWQFININRRLGATETAIEKLTSLLDNMMAEVNDVKELANGIDDLKKQILELEKQQSSLESRVKALESVDNSEEQKKLEDLIKELNKLKSRVNELPTKDDLDNLDIYVKWPQLEEALNARRTRTPTPKPRTPTPSPPTPTPPPRSPTPLHPSSEALEALRQVGELMDKHEDLAERVDGLEEEMPKKANLEDLEELRKRPAVPADIVDQLKRLKDAMDAINKWKEEKTIPADLEEQLKSLREGLALLDSHREQLKEMGEQLKRLKSVSDLLSSHNEKLPAKLERLEERMKENAEREARTLRDGLRLLNNQIEKIKKMSLSPPPSDGKTQGGGAIDSLRNMVLDLQAENEKLKNTTNELIEEENRKQKHLDALYSYCDKLQENKADKEQVAMEIDVKADKRSLDNLVSRLKFDQTVGTLDQAIQDLLSRLDGYDAGLKDALAQLGNEVDQKLDRMEIDPLKDYFERKIKAMKCKHADLPLNEDPAAGFRKALLRFHCISCDRPVDMAQGPPNPALPNTPGMPPSRSGRPYTTFELDQIRQMNRGVTYDQDGSMTTARSCGGIHTVTSPHKRSARFNQYYYFRDDEVVPVPMAQRDETEIVGDDGHIYKGRVDMDGNQFPEVSNSPRHKPKSPRAVSAKRSPSPQPPRTGSPTYRRPRSAVPSSPRSRGEGADPMPEIPAQS
ncbi:glutamine-rich protein 2 isoform X2 [Nematostella vectensis]|uniref:glutamine-rich protein 2 isoform X2 n=1 Tax=Nematostella vectensis TaxID=45351 RepID=UPI0020776690|nr:glutamine-rich protein 2 isoform X2 [Nematostella vectensis]